MPIITRRSLFVGLGAALAAPAIVRATSLMPVHSWIEPPREWVTINTMPLLPARDSGVVGRVLPAGEKIYVGDAVTIGRDGCAYRFRTMSPDVFHPISGIAVCNSSAVQVTAPYTTRSG